jgi:hypothetical protein
VVRAPDAPGVPFAGLGSDDDRRRYLAALGGEAIFPVPEPEPEPEPVIAAEASEAAEAEEAAEPAAAAMETEPVVAAAATGWEPEAETRREPAAEPAAEAAAGLPPTQPSGSATDAVDGQAAGYETAPPPGVAAAPGTAAPAAAADEPEATVTLGQLYLEQRHFTDAERIFRTVLDRDPANTAALLGLSEAERARPRALTAGDLLRWAAGRAGDGGERVPRSAERAVMLQAYLTRIREGSRADVP